MRSGSGACSLASSRRPMSLICARASARLSFRNCIQGLASPTFPRGSLQPFQPFPRPCSSQASFTTVRASSRPPTKPLPISSFPFHFWISSIEILSVAISRSVHPLWFPCVILTVWGEFHTRMATTADIPLPKTKREVIDRAVIRFAGDSGDGMQVTGSQFTNTVALYGNDIATFPDFPAEIRAPAGTLPGVSGYQLHFSSNEIFTPGDSVDVLIAMNPAALKMNLADLKANGILIVNSDAFT